MHVAKCSPLLCSIRLERVSQLQECIQLRRELQPTLASNSISCPHLAGTSQWTSHQPARPHALFACSQTTKCTQRCHPALGTHEARWFHQGGKEQTLITYPSTNLDIDRCCQTLEGYRTSSWRVLVVNIHKVTPRRRFHTIIRVSLLVRYRLL